MKFFKRNIRKNIHSYSKKHDLDTYPTLALSVYPFREQNISITDETLPTGILFKQSCLSFSSQRVIVLDNKRNVVSKK